jgi:hypothetical protein
MAEQRIENLERELRERALARNAELVVDTDPDGRFRAAFEEFVDLNDEPVDQMVASPDVILLETTAGDKRTALESLLAASEDEGGE